jgi:hypothetical protein
VCTYLLIVPQRGETGRKVETVAFVQQPALSRTIPISLIGRADDVIDFPAPAHNRI